MNELDSLLNAAASKAIDDGFTREMLDDHYGGNVHSWCIKNINYNPHQEFFVVFLVCGAIADKLAQAEGFADQYERAARLATERLNNEQRTTMGDPAVTRTRVCCRSKPGCADLH